MTATFNLDFQIESAPEAVRAVLSQAEIPILDPERPVVFTGIGASLHAARIASNWVTCLGGGRVQTCAVDAHDMGSWLPIGPGDQVVVISHRGTKIFPGLTLQRARSAGAKTIAVVGQTAPAQPADYTIRTCPDETAGTFTVSYLSSLAALARLVSTFDTAPQRDFSTAVDQLPQALTTTLASGDPAVVAAGVADCRTLLVIGFGIDLPTAQEAALKIKEGAWLWTEAMSPEFALHGTPASYTADMSAVLIDPAHDDSGRMQVLSTVLADLGLTTARVDQNPRSPLSFTTPHPLLQPVTSIVPLQRLTAELARLRGTNPDTMHGSRTPWERVMTGIRL